MHLWKLIASQQQKRVIQQNQNANQGMTFKLILKITFLG